MKRRSPSCGGSTVWTAGIGLRRGRDRAEVTRDLRQRLLLLEVADHHRGRVVGVVEDVVELLQTGRRDALDVAPPPDRRVVVRVLAEGRRERVLVEDLEGGVLAALELVADDRHLRLPVLVPDERPAHTRGLDPDRHLEPRRGKRLVVIRPVEPRRGVEARSERLEHGRDRRPLLAVVIAASP